MLKFLKGIYSPILGGFNGLALIAAVVAMMVLFTDTDLTKSTTFGFWVFVWVLLPMFFIALCLNASPLQILDFYYSPRDLTSVAVVIFLTTLYKGVDAALPELRLVSFALIVHASLSWVYLRYMGKRARKVVDDSDSVQSSSNSQSVQQSYSGAYDGHRTDYPAELSKVTFKDVVGMADLKARMREAVDQIVATREETKASRNGILFYGLPGNGKTLMAEAIAGEMNLPILTIQFGDFVSKWTGQGSEQLIAIFNSAREQAPCVLFLDEIDSLAGDRSSVVNSDSESAKMTNILLTEIVELRKLGVVVIAATNYIDKLDKAVIREGRFDFKIEIPNPDLEARKGLFANMLRKHGRIKIEEFAYEQAAKRWEGFSVSRIRAVIQETLIALAKEDRTVIQYSDLQIALRTIQGRKSKIPEDTPVVDDLVMPRDQKAKLLGMATRLKEIEAFEEHGGSAPTGSVFYGPPGTGKTLTARALAKSSGWAFLSISGADLLADKDVIDKLIADASDMRPCIVFIDEADDVCGNRENSSQYARSITNKLLAAMDGAGGKVPDVMWIAATNHPQNLDPAIQRRLAEKVEFSLPDQTALNEFVGKWIGSAKAEFDVQPADVASLVAGQSIAIVKDILQDAVNTAIHRNLAGPRARVVRVTEDDLRAAVQTIVG